MKIDSTFVTDSMLTSCHYSLKFKSCQWQLLKFSIFNTNIWDSLQNVNVHTVTLNWQLYFLFINGMCDLFYQKLNTEIFSQLKQKNHINHRQLIVWKKIKKKFDVACF